jgi:hypothetical protein
VTYPHQYPPQQPAQPGMDGYYGQPPTPGYPPAMPSQPVAPPGYPYPYPQQQTYAPPAPPPTASGGLDEFYNQPSTGHGKALSFPVVGTRFVGVVSQVIGNGHIQHQTNPQKVPQYYNDGRPKFVMIVPLQMQPSPQYPDGRGAWYVKGGDRDELARAMAEAGAPVGAPEYGAVVDVTYTGDRPAGVGMNQAKVKRVVYTRPSGALAASQPAAPAPASPPQPPMPPSPPAAPTAPPWPGQAPPPAAQQTYAPQPQPAAVNFQPPAQPAAAGVAPQPAAPPLPEMTPEQRALLAQLSGGQPA